MASQTDSAAPVAGELLRLIRNNRGLTRADLVRMSGLSRPTVAQRVSALVDGGLVLVVDSPPGRGRPPQKLVFNYRGGFLLGADVGGSHTRLALTDLAANVIDERELDIDVEAGPTRVLDAVVSGFNDLLTARAASPSEVRGIGVGVPGPVDSEGTLVTPPIMPSWDGVNVPTWIQQTFDAPVFVDRDANIIALGEHRWSWTEYRDIAVVKLGLGIGLGLIIGGEPYRGAAGAAGELGHLPRGGQRECRCGRRGCLEAEAGGWAIRDQLRDLGKQVHGSADILDLVLRGDQDAHRLLAEAGEVIGVALAEVVALYNPAVLVLAGNLADAEDPLLPAVRRAIRRASQPLGVRDLLVAKGRLGHRAGTIGATTMTHERLFDPTLISAQLGL